MRALLIKTALQKFPEGNPANSYTDHSPVRPPFLPATSAGSQVQRTSTEGERREQEQALTQH